MQSNLTRVLDRSRTKSADYVERMLAGKLAK